MTPELIDRERLVRVETQLSEVREDISEVKTDQKKLLWILVGYAVSSQLLDFAGSNIPGIAAAHAAIADIGKIFLGVG